MRDRIMEDLFLLAVLGVVIYLLWDRLAGAVGDVKAEISAAWDKIAEKKDAAVETVKTALSPVEAARNLFTIATSPDYISPADFRANIEKIKANLKGLPKL